jgi:hypothetical protein
MTTERELHDLLTAEADAPARPAPWDDIVRRGRHHRRVARVRTGLLAGGVAALAVLGGVAATDLGDEETTGVVADHPDVNTGPTTTRDLSRPDLSRLPDLTAARASGNHITLILGAAVPDEGFDPCTEQVPLVEATAEVVRITVAKTFELPGLVRWSACHASPFSGWGTVELDAPLGSRQVIDDRDGREIEVVDDAALLFPTELPAPFDVEQWDEFAQVTSEEMAVHEREWTFSWTTDDVVLNISWWSLTGQHPDGCTDGEAVDVRGGTGRLCTNESSALLSWIDGDSMRVIELVDVSGEALPGGIDLVAIADDLSPLG